MEILTDSGDDAITVLSADQSPVIRLAEVNEKDTRALGAWPIGQVEGLDTTISRYGITSTARRRMHAPPVRFGRGLAPPAPASMTHKTGHHTATPIARTVNAGPGAEARRQDGLTPPGSFAGGESWGRRNFFALFQLP